MRTDTIEEQLGELQQRLAVLPETEQPPPTTLQILGRSTREGDWQRLLIHFLTPDEGHGLGRNLLEHLLTALATRDDLGYSFSRFDLETVEVAQEVTTGQGRPDAVIWSEEDWFICFEMKVDAEEGADQTERYAAVDSFDGIGLETGAVPETRQHYVYLAPEDASPPASKTFSHVSWEWIASQLQSFIADSYGKYPARTTAQLEDSIATIRSELTMTDYQENQREKMELYVRYSQAIDEVTSAFDSEWKQFERDWGDRLAGAIEGGATESAPEVPDELVVFSFDDSDDQWIFRQTHDDWAWIFKDGWWRNVDTGDHVYTYDPSRPDARVGFVHRLDKHRDDAILDKELKFFFRNAPPNVEGFFDSFANRFVNDPGRERILKAKPERMALTGKQRTLLEGTYEINTAADQGFLDSYVGTLAEAVLDNVLDHEELITAIDDYYEESVSVIGQEP